MAYTYKYTVSHTGSTKTIQKAVDQIAYELKTESAAPAKDFEILLEPGSYAGCKIQRGSLISLLGTEINLVIKAAGNYFPIVDGKVTP